MNNSISVKFGPSRKKKSSNNNEKNFGKWDVQLLREQLKKRIGKVDACTFIELLRLAGYKKRVVDWLYYKKLRNGALHLVTLKKANIREVIQYTGKLEKRPRWSQFSFKDKQREVPLKKDCVPIEMKWVSSNIFPLGGYYKPKNSKQLIDVGRRDCVPVSFIYKTWRLVAEYTEEISNGQIKQYFHRVAEKEKKYIELKKREAQYNITNKDCIQIVESVKCIKEKGEWLEVGSRVIHPKGLNVEGSRISAERIMDTGTEIERFRVFEPGEEYNNKMIATRISFYKRNPGEEGAEGVVQQSSSSSSSRSTWNFD